MLQVRSVSKMKEHSLFLMLCLFWSSYSRVNHLPCLRSNPAEKYYDDIQEMKVTIRDHSNDK